MTGFGYTEGYLVLDRMQPGDKLTMIREDENKYDHEAIALFYGELHVGYIPKRFNSQPAMLMDFGYAEILECVITSVDKEAHPNEQVQIRVNLLRRE
ncbi:MAG: HIRAN domain-containing protein [Paludibacter sp.]|nr:HIRAN domain-containing protein [Bacteroidales bacterium]MCM1069802.1 HIRAN domain-containing protein [Prevotella sp.]MCM1482057.1 HIRAN domain-containing protein [Paludibacter sp.]